MVRVDKKLLANPRGTAIAASAALLIVAGMILSRQFTSAASSGTTLPANTAASVNTSVQSQSQVNSPQPQSGASASSSSSQSVDITGTGAAGNTSVTVNGQSIPVPQNGTVNRTIISDDGSTTVNVRSQTSGSTSGNASNTSRSSVNIYLDSNSSSTEDSL